MNFKSIFIYRDCQLKSFIYLLQLQPMHEKWDDGDSPPRVWSPNRKAGKVRLALYFVYSLICQW